MSCYNFLYIMYIKIIHLNFMYKRKLYREIMLQLSNEKMYLFMMKITICAIKTRKLNIKYEKTIKKFSLKIYRYGGTSY